MLELLKQFAAPVYRPASTDEVVNRLLRELADLGIYVHNEAVTTSSRYLKFEDDRIGSIRVGDHPGKKKYGYRWNILLGSDGTRTEIDRGKKRWYYHASDIEDFVRHVRNYAEALSPDPDPYRDVDDYGGPDDGLF